MYPETNLDDEGATTHCALLETHIPDPVLETHIGVPFETHREAPPETIPALDSPHPRTTALKDHHSPSSPKNFHAPIETHRRSKSTSSVIPGNEDDIYLTKLTRIDSQREQVS